MLSTPGIHPPAHARPEVDQLRLLAARLAAVPGLSARFREEKHLALLVSPLLSEGTLYFSPPNLLLRRVDSPIPSSVLIREGRLSMTSEGGLMTIGLDEDPVVRVFADSLRMVLSGDLSGLRTIYEVELTAFDPAEEGLFALQLKPLDPALRSVLSAIEVQGRGTKITQLKVQEAGGDFSITRFTEFNNEREFESEEIDSIFALPPS
ncbi:MAG: outer membrane lipoprotein carrier protein LolA [Myxococcota bacterium]|nr:outer membrane lipoprotein carrier protein LolA [Myxococcota bacterium]